MPLANDLTLVQTKIAARLSDIDSLLALGQNSTTTTLLNSIKAELFQLQSQHNNIISELYTFPTKINTKLGFNSTLDQAKIEQNYQVLEALDNCENPQNFYTSLACALLGAANWILGDFDFVQSLRSFLVSEIQASVGTEFTGTGLTIDRLIQIYDYVASCDQLSGEELYSCLVTQLTQYPELEIPLKKRYIDLIYSIVGFNFYAELMSLANLQ
jgi:hypothetical protein